MQHQPSILKKHLKWDGLNDSHWSDAARLLYIATGVCFSWGTSFGYVWQGCCVFHLHKSCFYKTGIHQRELKKLFHASILLKKELLLTFMWFCAR